VSAGADGTLRVWNAGSGALVRSIELDEGAATAIAVDDRRALTGHKGGAIVLWDLERAEKLGVFQNQQSAISALAFTGDADHFAAASQVGAVALFDIRTPSAPATVFEGQDGAQAIASTRWSGLLASAGQTAASACGGRIRAIQHHGWRDQAIPWALDMPGGAALPAAARTARCGCGPPRHAPQRSFKAHEGQRTRSRSRQRSHARLGGRGRPGAVDRATAGNLASFAATPDRSTRRLPARRPPRHLRRPGDGVIRVWSTSAAAVQRGSENSMLLGRCA
jgi:hypothetical protein